MGIHNVLLCHVLIEKQQRKSCHQGVSGTNKEVVGLCSGAVVFSACPCCDIGVYGEAGNLDLDVKCLIFKCYPLLYIGQTKHTDGNH